MHYGFLDESGILERKAREGSYFAVSVMIVANPAEIKDVMKIVRRKARGKFRISSSFHAYKEGAGVVGLVLEELAKRDVGIVIGVWDKRKRKSKMPKNTLYGRILAQTVRSALKLYPKLNLVLHKRYNDPEIINRINNELERVLEPGQELSIDHKTEVVRRELELADAVAWAVFQKYNRKKEDFYKIIEGRIKKESRLAA